MFQDIKVVTRTVSPPFYVSHQFALLTAPTGRPKSWPATLALLSQEFKLTPAVFSPLNRDAALKGLAPKALGRGNF